MKLMKNLVVQSLVALLIVLIISSGSPPGVTGI
jgi:hypothetical protein